MLFFNKPLALFSLTRIVRLPFKSSNIIWISDFQYIIVVHWIGAAKSRNAKRLHLLTINICVCEKTSDDFNPLLVIFHLFVCWPWKSLMHFSQNIERSMFSYKTLFLLFWVIFHQKKKAPWYFMLLLANILICSNQMM